MKKRITVNRNKRNRRTLGLITLDGIPYPFWDLDWFWRAVESSDTPHSPYPDRDPTYTGPYLQRFNDEPDTE